MSGIPMFLRRSALLVAASLAAAACDQRPPTGVSGNVDALVSKIHIDQRSTTIAVGDTVRLTSASTTLGGTVTPNPANVTYRSISPTQISVTSDGLVTALTPTPDGAVGVVATLISDSATVADTVKVFSTASRETIVKFGLLIDDYDGTTIGVGYSTDLLGYAVTTAGDTITGFPIAYTTSSPKAQVNIYGDYGYFSSNDFGRVVVYGAATLYGATYQDSVAYTITYADEANVGWNTGIWNYPPSLQVVLKPGGHVWWYNWGSETSNAVTFDDPSKATAYADDSEGGSGNIPAFSGTRKARQFNTPGTYTWTSGTQKGKVIVMPTAVPTTP